MLLLKCIASKGRIAVTCLLYALCVRSIVLELRPTCRKIMKTQATITILGVYNWNNSTKKHSNVYLRTWPDESHKQRNNNNNKWRLKIIICWISDLCCIWLHVFLITSTRIAGIGGRQETTTNTKSMPWSIFQSHRRTHTRIQPIRARQRKEQMNSRKNRIDYELPFT